jgi:DNA polymerase elongation subunit (family B)
MGAMKGKLGYFRNARINYKNLAAEWYEKDKKKSLSYDRKQLPIKIFINSLFGALSAPQVFPWGDMFMGEQITCTGRQYLRQMSKFFIKKGYTPLVCDTDGQNFSLPEGGVDDRVYIGKGLNWKVKKDKEYRGCDADVAEYNDIFMRGAMALDCDGTWKSCINLARKNYATMEHNGKVKLTGNSIKSKKLPLYIEDFLDKAIKLLLEGEGQQFVEWYYEYLTKIYNKEIPLLKIAQRAKVKLSIKDYIERSKQTTKSGGAMSRMAHMELVIKHNLKVNLGEVIYYVNNGTKASHGDVQKKKDEILLNCYMLNSNDIENNPNMTGEYNVARAITTFNNRIEPLLIVFKQDVRDNLIVDNPEKRTFFTSQQCELINGVPFEEKDQDRVQEDLLDLEPKELEYWEKRGSDPNYIYDLAEEGWEKYIN